jgi:hypothetical protein
MNMYSLMSFWINCIKEIKINYMEERKMKKEIDVYMI